MAGIAGVVSVRKNVLEERDSVGKMVDKIRTRGKEGVKFSAGEHAIIGVSNFYKMAGEQSLMPLSYFVGENEYILAFDGEIFNKDAIKSELESRGVKIETGAAPEILLKSFVEWGPGCLEKLNGVFAFVVWDKKRSELFMARDRFGIKPLYYTIFDDTLIFASEIKALLAHEAVRPVLDADGITEVVVLGPAHTPGSGIFKNIYEMLPAHFAFFGRDGFSARKYWSLENKEHADSLDDTIEKVRELTFGAINRQLEADEDLCCFLSGGVDSSTIVALAAQKFPKLRTYSLEYEGNDEFFRPTEYQPDSDEFYIQKMVDEFSTDHEIVRISNRELLDLLADATIARDAPGMGDVDSSLHYICGEVAKDFHIAMSGECGDEVFGGYPWFFRDEDLKRKMFPWAKNIGFRKSLLAPNLAGEIDAEKILTNKYEASVRAVPRADFDADDEYARRQFAAINFEWFMYTLGERSERIGMDNTLFIRMPYCDHTLVEYVWNIPWEFKAYDGREKGLLRKAAETILPHEVAWRKKSPFPKTHNPEFERLARERALSIISDPSSSVSKLINPAFVRETAAAKSDYRKPWFGQLMATPQLFAYVIQLDAWLRHYDVKIEV
jgi:asparagine synthase (glutamine-hydrolysing)